MIYESYILPTKKDLCHDPRVYLGFRLEIEKSMRKRAEIEGETKQKQRIDGELDRKRGRKARI